MSPNTVQIERPLRSVDCKVIIASRRSNRSRLQAIRQYSESDAKRLIQRFECLDHANVLSARDCYLDGLSLYALVKDLPLTLQHLVSCPRIYPTELELGSIMSQILAGLHCLSTVGLFHESLSCREILLGLDGMVKIACLEKCIEGSPSESQTRYITALPSIIMSLIQKHEKVKGIVGVDDMHRWPVDSASVGFLSASSLAQSIASLQNHPLVATRRRPAADLVMLARIVFIAAEVPVSYEIEGLLANEASDEAKETTHSKITKVIAVIDDSGHEVSTPADIPHLDNTHPEL
ncbi:hypothetical protein POX_c04616 [Penicillium oxalicum]|uniref:hypothetical protein n=1 Tax=Penicillium oxalicum TaxID=69781 RepID=UPI0020B8786F|nr:hypothetical protein POX_c04616 [Penicillium oxalicum]KAI2791739.1 hypothetical protein POX_c04616 [Penicillium oxalicum]